MMILIHTILLTWRANALISVLAELDPQCPNILRHTFLLGASHSSTVNYFSLLQVTIFNLSIGTP